MKSFFLVTLVLVLMANIASAQNSAKSTTPAAEVKKSSFDKFYDRLKISYFGVLTTPHLENIKHNRWKNAAISPEWSGEGDDKNEDTWPTNVWQQVAFSYNFGAKMSFVVAPRFMIPLTHPKSMKPVEDRSLFMIDDVLVGFQGVVYASDDKKFNLWIRPAFRLPTSRASRNGGNGGAGTLSNQFEVAFSPTYDFNKTWQLGMFGMFRQWIIEDAVNFSRFRSLTNPYIQYTIDDVSKIQLYYELILETDRRSKPAYDRDPVMKDRWQNVTLGYGRDITSKLHLMPTVGCFVNEPITDKSVWLGAWIIYQIK